MDIEFFLTWFGVMFPLVFSPGPANIVLAGAGMKQGVLRSYPLILGINLVIVGYSLLIGFGLGNVMNTYPLVLLGIKILGIIYLLYLAFKFLRSHKKESGSKLMVYGFFDGFLLQLLNPKGMLMILMMFSLFMDEHSTSDIFKLTFMLISLCFVSHTIWVFGGGIIHRLFFSNKTEKAINYFFAISLSLVAIWLLVDALRSY